MTEEVSIGEYLRRLREEKGCSLEEAAQATKIKLENLHAIESDEIAKHVPAIYAKALIKLYAEFLRVDAAGVVERFRRLHGDASPVPARAPSASSSKTARARVLTQVPRPVILGGAAVAVLISLCCIYLLSSPRYKLTVRAIGRVPIKVYRDGQFVEGSTIEPGKTKSWRAKKRLELKISKPENAEVICKGAKVDLPRNASVSIVLDKGGIIKKSIVSPSPGK